MTGGVTCAADDGTGGLLRGPAHLDRAAREEGKRPPEGGRLAGARSGPRRVLRSTPQGGSRRGRREEGSPSATRGRRPRTTPGSRTSTLLPGRTSATCGATRFRASGQSRSVAVVNIINFTDKDSGQAGFAGVR